MHRATNEPKVELQVLCLGLPRCATTSIAAALESDVVALKPTLHASSTSVQGTRGALVTDALRLTGSGGDNTAARRAKLREFMRGYAASVESLNPVADDLMDMYPEAKLILNVRPPSRSGASSASVDWARSCKETIGFFGSLWVMAACWPLRRHLYWWRRYRLHTDIWRQKQLLPAASPSSFLSPKGCEWMSPEFYDQYLHWVQGEAKKRDREILVWHPGQGWPPLCEFLGKDAPPEGTPLPYLNDGGNVKILQAGDIRMGLLRQVMCVALTLFLYWTVSTLIAACNISPKAVA